MVQHLSARVFINKPKLEPYLQCSSSPNFCTSQPGLRGWGQNGGSLANFSFVHQRGVDTNYPAMSSQLQALPKPGRARVLLREDYGGERQARVPAWQGLSCWRPGRLGSWSPSAALPQHWGSALHICLVWALCSCGLTVPVSESVSLMFVTGEQGQSVPAPNWREESHQNWHDSRDPQELKEGSADPRWDKGNVCTTCLGRADLWAGTRPMGGRENEEVGDEGCCQVNKPAQRLFSVTEATEHCQTCICMANPSPKIKSDCLDTTSWRWLWLLSSPEPCWGMLRAGWHPGQGRGQPCAPNASPGTHAGSFLLPSSPVWTQPKVLQWGSYSRYSSFGELATLCSS